MLNVVLASALLKQHNGSGDGSQIPTSKPVQYDVKARGSCSGPAVLVRLGRQCRGVCVVLLATQLADWCPGFHAGACCSCRSTGISTCGRLYMPHQVSCAHVSSSKADAGPPVAGGGVNAVACSLGVVAVSCALFGVTYRYAVRGEDANPQLKAGVVAAFGLVRSRLGLGLCLGFKWCGSMWRVTLGDVPALGACSRCGCCSGCEKPLAVGARLCSSGSGCRRGVTRLCRGQLTSQALHPSMGIRSLHILPEPERAGKLLVATMGGD